MENISKHVAEKDEDGMEVPGTLRRSGSPTFENTDSDDAMTEVKCRDEEPYMMSTEKGKKCNKRKGVERP